jgi:hypothetical protein
MSLSLLSKKEELPLFPPVEAFVLHIFHMTILPSDHTAPLNNSPHQQTIGKEKLSLQHHKRAT